MMLAICTRADANNPEIVAQAKISHHIFRMYAESLGADFIILDGESPCQVGHGKWHFRIFELKKILENYDRVLSVDTDVILVPGLENLFDLIPETHIGTIFEDKGSRKEARRQVIRQVQRAWGDVDWRMNYINTGLFMVSRVHANIFSDVDGKFWTGFGYDDVQLMYNIMRFGHPVFELPMQYNFMSMFSEEWTNWESRFDNDVKVIHYAGNGKFPDKKKFSSVSEMMAHDARIIWGL